MKPKKRYVQPQTVREAMETIQKLFNSYRHAPLTQDLLNYHINLTNRLQTDIYVAALREKNDKQLEGDIIRELGHEYGTTTQRPRRCGWMDAVILRTAKYTCGIDYLCINHLDTLGKIGLKLGYIKICTAYNYQGKVIDYYPDDIGVTGKMPIPIYETLNGGFEISSDCKSYDDLPELAKRFISIIEKTSNIKVRYVGIGPANDDLIEINTDSKL